MLVLTDELVSMAGQIAGGVEVSKETLLLDEVHRVGPDGHYVEAESTLERFRHFWYPGLFDRSRRHQWEKAGAATLGQRLTERVKEIVGGHRVRRMKKDRVEMIRELLVTAGDDAV
jgi:trimethylamine--corrinoid protein Co-methyltransferase